MENKETKVEKTPSNSTITWPDTAPDFNKAADKFKPTIGVGFKQQNDAPDMLTPDAQIKHTGDV